MTPTKETTPFDGNHSIPEEGHQFPNSYEENMKFSPVENFSNKLGFDMVMSNRYDGNNGGNENQNLSVDQMSWTDQHESGFRGGFLATNFTDGHPYPPTHEFLDLFNQSRCPSVSSFAPNSMISFSHPVTNFNSSLGFLGDQDISHTLSVNVATATFYDPLYHMDPPPPQQPSITEMIQSTLPRGYNFSGLNGPFFGEEDEREVIGVYQDMDGRELESEVLEFTGAKSRKGKGKEGNATERKRRVEFSGKYDALRSLLPNPNKMTKPDRASIVGEAIEYIKELKREVNELSNLVEKKRRGKERNKRHGAEEDGVGDYNGSLRCSWVQRKSKNAEVDVRIIDDEVTIKMVQRKRINCLLLVSKILDELQLDLQHAAGGHTGDFYSYLFNTKIYEGSSVYATGIANKLLEAVERQYAAVPLSSKY